MGILEDICAFYKKVVFLLLDDDAIASSFIKQVAVSMMYGKEQDIDVFSSSKLYEKLFRDSICEISSEELEEEVNLIKSLESMLSSKSDLKEVAPTIEEAYQYFSKMSKVTRAGWIARNVPNTHGESDAVHIMQMFALAYIYFKLDKSLNLDKKKVYEMIIIHEIGEALVGDIREGTEEHKDKTSSEKEAIEKIFSTLKNGQYFIELWQEFEQHQTEEAEFAYHIDKIDPILKAKILDYKLNRNDLYDDFYGYEERRQTYNKGKVKELFYYSKKMEVRNI